MKKVLALFLVAGLGCASYEEMLWQIQTSQSKDLQKSLEVSQNKKLRPLLPSKDFEKELEKAKKRIEKLSKKGFPKGWDGFLSSLLSKFPEISQKKGKDLLRKKVSLELLFAYSFLHNPEFQKAYELWKGVQREYRQVDFLETIVQTYRGFLADSMMLVGPKLSLPFSKRYPYPSTLSLKGKILKEEEKIAYWRYQKVLRDGLVRLGKAYYDLWFWSQALRIYREHKKLLEHIHKVSLKRFEGGKLSESVVLRVQMEIAKISDGIITVEEKYKTALAALARELSLPKSFPFGEFLPPSLSLPKESLLELRKRSETLREEVRIAKAQWEKLSSMVELLEEKFHPDFVQGFAYELVPPYGWKEKKGKVIPRPISVWFGSQRAYIEELSHKAEAAKKAYFDVLDETRFLVKKFWYDLSEARRAEELYRRSLLPWAKQAYQVVQREYEGGRASFDSLVDAERLWLNYQLKWYGAKRDMGKRVLDLWRVSPPKEVW